MSISRDQLLEVALVAYPKIASEGWGDALARVGYGAERQQAGLAQAHTLREKRQAQQAAQARQLDISARLKAAFKARHAEFVAFKRAVTAADKLFPGQGLTERLNLAATPRGFGEFCAIARRLYQTARDDAAIRDALAQVGHSAEQTAALLQSLDETESLNVQQESAKGDAQRLTQEVKALEKAVRADLGALKAAVRIAFPAPQQVQVMESLRLSAM